MYAYLLFLFFDFAGYSLLAMALGNMVGMSVPYNFNQPFLAINPKEFWQRWHKSLGDWLNDYFFKPILRYLTTKNLYTPITRQSIALFSTFTLMGFWNGFEWHYIISGMLFGLYSVIHNYYQMQCKKNKRDVVFGNMNPKVVQYISIFIMFQLVAISIYIFSGKLF
jgi:membrane protein involved in D-alanine export